MPLPTIQRLGLYFSGFFKYETKLVNAKAYFGLYDYDTYYTENEQYYQQKYYPNWRQTLYPKREKLSAEGIDLDGNHLFLKNVAILNDDLRKNDHPFRIRKVDVYLFREELAIFTISIEPPEDVQWQFGDISRLTKVLRDTTVNSNHNYNLHQNNTNPLIDIVKQNILLHFTKDSKAWLEFNPQLKLFMNIDVKEVFEHEDTFNYLLFDLATVSPLGTAGSKQLFSPSQRYYEEIMQNNVIELFCNWKVLCLFDSFVRISINLKEADKFNLWENDYFAIYIFTAFVRFYLYQTNAQLAGLRPDNVEETEKIRNSFIRFMNDYEMTEIAYKFLPNHIFREMQKAFGVSGEIQKTGEKINQLNTWIHEKHQKVIEKHQKVIEERQKTVGAWLSLIGILELFALFYYIKSYYSHDPHKDLSLFLKVLPIIVVISLAIVVFKVKKKWGGEEL